MSTRRRNHDGKIEKTVNAISTAVEYCDLAEADDLLREAIREAKLEELLRWSAPVEYSYPEWQRLVHDRIAELGGP